MPAKRNVVCGPGAVAHQACRANRGGRESLQLHGGLKGPQSCASALTTGSDGTHINDQGVTSIRPSQLEVINVANI